MIQLAITISKCRTSQNLLAPCSLHGIFVTLQQNVQPFTIRHSNKMKKAILSLSLLALLSCTGHESIDERALRETKEHTRKFCPQKINEFTTLDSITYDIKTHTFTEYLTLHGTADDKERAELQSIQLHDNLAEAVRNDTSQKRYKDAGCSYRFVARSASNKDVIIYEETITQADYQ